MREKIEKHFSLLLWSFTVFLFYGDAECGNLYILLGDDDSLSSSVRSREGGKYKFLESFIRKENFIEVVLKISF